MLIRFDDSIIFKVSAIIAVNNASSDSVKSCKHLIQEVLTKDEDSFSLMVYDESFLK